MAEIVNLRRARKVKARATAEKQAAANRAAFGRTRAEKAQDAAERTRVDTTLDGARRDP
ncbi:DUF4169 family protein [Sphingomonas rubra]|uniref:DUF4169 domain-containing protein n=1 Tax=Sphingomonas rubra TaxID=634430 RepID=A0A1I5TXL6_9SPHN|nr:DUF4169 family protein [Sphingomonas rubra]SFP87778.1 protein of unknown function [Sphingomonas rubra]